MAIRNYVSLEEGDELRRLYAEYADATNRALAFLTSEGATSPNFLDADKEAGRASKRIKEILNA